MKGRAAVPGPAPTRCRSNGCPTCRTACARCRRRATSTVTTSGTCGPRCAWCRVVTRSACVRPRSSCRTRPRPCRACAAPPPTTGWRCRRSSATTWTTPSASWAWPRPTGASRRKWPSCPSTSPWRARTTGARWTWRRPPPSAGRSSGRWASPTPRRCRATAAMPRPRTTCGPRSSSGAATSPASTGCWRTAKSAPASRCRRAATWRAITS